MERLIDELFPNLVMDGYRITSAPTDAYNCIAWAAQITAHWWWPGYGPRNRWPPEIRRDETIQAFVDAFESSGYEICNGSEPETGFEKVAVFAVESQPTHVARQLTNGVWTSKLGELEDIEHTLRGLEGAIYGTATVFLKRPTIAS